MKKTSLLAIAAGLFFLVPSLALAYSVKTDNSVFIPKEEVVDGNLYAAGSNITVDGEVNGDIVCAGRSININGSVKGDVICVGQTINIRGKVDGSVRLVGDMAMIDGTVSKGLQFFGTNLVLGKDSEIGWDAFLAGESAVVQGKVKGMLHGALSTLDLSGEIGKDVKVRLDYRPELEKSLSLSEAAVINGNLYYTAGNKGMINPGAKITGDVGFTQTETPSRQPDYGRKAWSWIISLFSALVLGLVIVTLFKPSIEKIITAMKEKPAVAIGWGIVVLFITPLVSLILLITLIGIPLSLMLLAVWAICLYCAKIMSGILLGRIFLDKIAKPGETQSLMRAMIVGVFFLSIITAVPVIGWIISLTAVFLGLGGIWLHIKK